MMLKIPFVIGVCEKVPVSSCLGWNAGVNSCFQTAVNQLLVIV